jgi:hypothetical protein
MQKSVETFAPVQGARFLERRLGRLSGASAFRACSKQSRRWHPIGVASCVATVMMGLPSCKMKIIFILQEGKPTKMRVGRVGQWPVFIGAFTKETSRRDSHSRPHFHSDSQSASQSPNCNTST